MKKPINNEVIAGRLFSHELELRTVQNKESDNFGKEFIMGTIDIAIDEDGLNVIPVHYTYVTEKTSKGATNATFTALKRIIDGAKTWTSDGKDEAIFVKAEPSLALNEFFKEDGTLISSKRNEGGFLSIIKSLDEAKDRNKFTVDMLITNTKNVEADEEKGIEEHLIVSGAIFNFRKDLLPIEFSVKNPNGISYFEGLGASKAEPVFTKVWGKINSLTQTIEKKEESAFGEASVSTIKRTSREWVITGTSPTTYEFGEEDALTVDEVNKASQDRQVMLAELKKRRDDWNAQKATKIPTAAPAANVPSGEFNF